MSWLLECNSKSFYNKLEAIKENMRSKKPIKFTTPDSYKTFDFSSEPNDTLEHLCKIEARGLRDKYEELFLYYSGGCDSHYILQTFLDNNIKIDKIIMVKSGYESADFEINDHALPFVKKLNIPYEVKCPGQKYYRDFYLNHSIEYRTQNEFWHHFRLNNHYETLGSTPSNRVNVFGKEKPKLVFEQENWYTYFLDVEVTNQPHQYNFYIENPVIHAKQCHMLIKSIIEHKETHQYNHVTHYNENQDFWNRSIGRYSKESFPLKFINEGGFYNNKDQMAIRSADPKLVTAWKERNNRLTRLLGHQWFNQGDPSFGTIGVFSEFYGLTKQDIKTVNDLYPKGFKI